MCCLASDLVFAMCLVLRQEGPGGPWLIKEEAATDRPLEGTKWHKWIIEKGVLATDGEGEKQVGVGETAC